MAVSGESKIIFLFFYMMVDGDLACSVSYLASQHAQQLSKAFTWLLLAAGHLLVLRGELQAAGLQQRVRVPVVGPGHRLVHGAVLHALHPRQPSLQTLQSQGNLQRGQHSMLLLACHSNGSMRCFPLC